MPKEKIGYMAGLPNRASAILGKTTRDIFLRKSIIFAMFFLLIPSFISIYSLADTTEDFKEWWGLYSVLGLYMYLQFLVLLYSLIYGSSLVNEDIENRTMTYMVIRGAKKGEVYLWKYIGTVISLMIMFTVSIITMYVILAGHGSARFVLIRTDMLLHLLLASYAGIIFFTALFSFIGVIFKRPLMIGLLYAFFWEIVMVNIPFNIQYATGMHYLRSIFTGSDIVRTVVADILSDAIDLDRMVNAPFAFIFLAALSVVLVMAGVYAISRKDIN
ncbi:MAG: ABC transporter permease [Thermoplasmatota archaeon]